jgi:hypothetical protein
VFASPSQVEISSNDLCILGKAAGFFPLTIPKILKKNSKAEKKHFWPLFKILGPPCDDVASAGTFDQWGL